MGLLPTWSLVSIKELHVQLTISWSSECPTVSQWKVFPPSSELLFCNNFGKRHTEVFSYSLLSPAVNMSMQYYQVHSGMLLLHHSSFQKRRGRETDRQTDLATSSASLCNNNGGVDLGERELEWTWEGRLAGRSNSGGQSPVHHIQRQIWKGVGLSSLLNEGNSYSKCPIPTSPPALLRTPSF